MSNSTHGHYYRFIAGDLGIYEAVDRDCPRDDSRRTLKPDGSWLPKVGEKYLGGVSFWTEYGLKKYLESGLQEWHRSVVRDPIHILKTQSIDSVLYEDEYQIITRGGRSALQMSWEEFAMGYTDYPIVEKVVAYILRGEDGQRDVLVFEHDKEWSEAGVQVPSGTVDLGEDIKDALLREVEEECGISRLEVVTKLDEYVMYRSTHNQFHRRHVFLLRAPDTSCDRWIHSVKGHGVDQGMNFHFYWMPIQAAEFKLAAGQGSSLRKLSK